MTRIKRRLRWIILRVRKRASPGLVLSLALHGIVVVLVLLTLTMPTAPPLTQILVDLVSRGPDTAMTGAAGDQTRREVSSPARQPQPRVPKPTATPEDIAELLQRAEAAHTASIGYANGVSGAYPGKSSGGGRRRDLKDIIRAQIAQRWQVARTSPDVVVQLRLQLAADGTVQSADIVGDNPNEPVIHAIAVAARNAAHLSSPLQLPAGTDAALDVTVDLDTRDARR